MKLSRQTTLRSQATVTGVGVHSGLPVNLTIVRLHVRPKTLALIKTIDIDSKVSPDGILADPFNQRIYVFSHPTMDATVIDAKDGTVLGTIDLGGVPEQGVADGKGILYVVMQDAEGSVTAVDVKTK